MQNLNVDNIGLLSVDDDDDEDDGDDAETSCVSLLWVNVCIHFKRDILATSFCCHSVVHSIKIHFRQNLRRQFVVKQTEKPEPVARS